MKKTSLAFLLSVCLILVMMVVALSGTGDDGNVCGKNLIWVYDPDTYTLTISGSGPMRDYPHKTHDKRTHPWAEYDQEIRTIIVEEGVTYLGTCAFCTCSSLTEVRLPVSLTVIGENAFWKCPKLTSVTIPRKVTTIAANAFKKCDSLTNITFLGNAPTKVAGTAFMGIVANAYYPARNGSWKDSTMVGHGGTLLYHGYEDPTNIQYLTDRGPCGPDAAWRMEDGTLTVSGTGNMEYALWNSLKDQIQKVVIEEGITSVAANAFTGCSRLTEVQLPSTLETIHKNAFALIPGLTQIRIPDNVTTIEGGAFAGCTSLGWVDLPTKLQTLARRAFFACTALEEITIPASVTRMGSEAFGACYALGKVMFLGRGPHMDDVTVFAQCPATVSYPADQIYWTRLRDGLSGTGLRWAPYCSGVHSENVGTVISEASCSSFGRTDCVCPVCGLAYTVETAPADHTFSDGLCTVCGYGQPLPPMLQYCLRRDETSIKVTWLPVEGAAGYELFRTTVAEPTDQDWQCAKSAIDPSVDSYINRDLEPGVTYYYKIRSYHYSLSGRKIYSEFSSVEPAVDPVRLTKAYCNAPGSIRLLWDRVPGATGYQVWRMDEDGNYTIVKTIGDSGDVLTNDQGATTAYGNTDLTPGQRYTYKVRAFRITEAGLKMFGEFSVPVTITALSEVPEE